MGVLRIENGLATVNEQGAYLLAKPCECGAFNPVRAAQVLEAVRLKG